MALRVESVAALFPVVSWPPVSVVVPVSGFVPEVLSDGVTTPPFSYRQEIKVKPTKDVTIMVLNFIVEIIW